MSKSDVKPLWHSIMKELLSSYRRMIVIYARGNRVKDRLVVRPEDTEEAILLHIRAMAANCRLRSSDAPKGVWVRAGKLPMPSGKTLADDCNEYNSFVSNQLGD